MRPPRRLWRTVPIAVAIGVGFLMGGAWPSGRADAAPTAPAFYLDVGGSASVGFQPTVASPRGQPTDSGYANDLVNAERSIWPTLQLQEVGCPGATTATMLEGGGHCAYQDGTQLATAVDFLRDHPTTVLVTVDLGFNNMRSCIVAGQIDQPCVDQSISLVEQQLPVILSALRAAGSPGLRIVGIGHYDPYLGSYLRGPTGRVLAPESLDAISGLDQALRSIYAASGIPMADVAGSFNTASTNPTMMSGVGMVPRDVARICTLTWMCAAKPFGPNQHPNDDGYRVISQAIMAALAGG
ncbi:MAG TPA: SGNH/GDSL hydrolase family protein [Acidimicrobiales bacterium]|nr:SGNH/GDSL hydrolase family protein [Acidimicrobiales bacterium]